MLIHELLRHKLVSREPKIHELLVFELVVHKMQVYEPPI